MSVLAIPDTSQVLLVDPVADFLVQLDNAFAELTRKRFECLAKAANEARVPRIHAVSSEVGSDGQWLSKPCEKRTARVFRFERDRSVWSNSELLDAVNTEQRPQLYICGFWLDDVVAAAAIEAQTHAFDTHIVTDLSPAYSRECHRPFIDRMMQYGIVPIVLQTLLYEWMTNTEDSVRRRVLEELWQQNKQAEIRGASASRTGLS